MSTGKLIRLYYTTYYNDHYNWNYINGWYFYNTAWNYLYN